MSLKDSTDIKFICFNLRLLRAMSKSGKSLSAFLVIVAKKVFTLSHVERNLSFDP